MCRLVVRPHMSYFCLIYVSHTMSHTAPVALQDELKAQTPTSEHTGPYIDAGAVTRLERRVLQAPDPKCLNLAHSLWGRSQMAVVQVCTCVLSSVLEARVSGFAVCRCVMPRHQVLNIASVCLCTWSGDSLLGVQ